MKVGLNITKGMGNNNVVLAVLKIFTKEKYLLIVTPERKEIRY